MAKKKTQNIFKKHLSLDIFKPGKITVYVYVIIICLILGFAILSFVSGFNKADKYKEEAIANCIADCKMMLGIGESLNNGPCISNNIAPGWVCDSVNDPRNKFVDNQIENQCEAYKNGTNKKFVEVSTTCNFVRTN